MLNKIFKKLFLNFRKEDDWFYFRAFRFGENSCTDKKLRGRISKVAINNNVVVQTWKLLSKKIKAALQKSTIFWCDLKGYMP